MITPEPVEFDAYGLRFSMYRLSVGEGQPLHLHPWEHSILIVAGRVILSTQEGELAYEGPRSPIYARAGRLHGFRAESPAIVINITKLEDLNKEFI